MQKRLQSGFCLEKFAALSGGTKVPQVKFARQNVNMGSGESQGGHCATWTPTAVAEGGLVALPARGVR